MMTLNRYKTKFNNPNYSYKLHNLQYQDLNYDNYYTSGGYDMIDDFNQRDFGNDFPIDRVNSYSLKQLQDGLKGARYWNQWKDNLKSKYNNPTEMYLDELFNNWQD
ncbi:hypothetical protein [Flavobacterium restrictum]|uniref:Uncharacterized protein n=1 Tax=Flavobacterium restrictum TaxID=2594428 RepID=A0A553EB15_9FLAO|nr:hypothetical protein [Flavobacterium restrictum]TRX42236.1 hypothetical protein FNW21_02960 [Flavobacterium restrictum]